VRTFGEDVALLRQHVDVIVLSSDGGRSKVAIVPAYQGRVMTSTAGGDAGVGFGFINDEAVIAGTTHARINVFGGEDRLWLGPEGGQFALFFQSGDPFDLEHWQTPALIDTASYAVVSQSPQHVEFAHQARVTNYSGFRFEIGIRRHIRQLDREETEAVLRTPHSRNIAQVAFESENTLFNSGRETWTKKRGLVSIWILGMLKHSPTCTIAIPFRTGPEVELGRIVNDDYFGHVPQDRLRVDQEAGVIYFRGDGEYRSKIGVSPLRAKGVAGSYDPARELLTIIQFTLSEQTTDYVNSLWQRQTEPFGGDVVNSYNDGPPAPGKGPLGPFYELESSSPAAAIAPGESVRHIHRTIHMIGSAASLNPVAKQLLGVEVTEMASALGR
jgi:hypothetical protein